MSDDLDLSCVDVSEFLEMLDVGRVTKEDGEARFSCPYPAHGYGDKNPSAYMNLENTAFICFSCGAKGNAITFLADVKEVNRLTAKNWIAQRWAPHYAKIDDLSAFVKGMFEKQEKRKEIEIFEPLLEQEYEKRAVDWESLEFTYQANADALTKEDSPGWATYLFDRGLDSLTLNLWDFCYDTHSDRPCITVRTQAGELVGFKGRAWTDSQQPKYMVLGDTERNGQPYGFKPYDAVKHVFGAHMAEPSKDRGLIVCEGELNVVSMHSKGFVDTVGPSGSTLSDKQVRDIVAQTDKVTILFDTDPQNPQQYMTAKLKVLRAVREFEKYLPVYVCPDHEGDPAEMDVDTIKEILDNAQSSTLWRISQTSS